MDKNFIKNVITSLIVVLLMGVSVSNMQAHNPIYKISWKKDGALIGSGIALSLLGEILLHNADRATLRSISNLDRNNVWAIDRRATNNYSSTAETVSDVILYTSLVLPFTMYAFDERKGSELELLVMTAETFLITYGITNITKSVVGRYRPFNYNSEVDEETKLGKGSRLSFFSGHASNTAALCFLTAQSLVDLHPHWKKKKIVIWSTAATLPLAISYGRYLAGKHFPTDVLAGYLLGAGVGLLIPRIHRDKKFEAHLGLNNLKFTYNLN